MALTRLSLKNFRNFGAIEITPHPEFNFIFGRNAQGKTNLIEAIYYLSALKSFRTSDKLELMARGAEFAAMGARYGKDGLDWEVSVALTPQERRVLVNGKKPASRKEFHELMPLILFEPRDIYLFRDSPSGRRQFLNRALFLQDAGFLSLVTDYEKIISQKNRLLKERPDFEQISIWNERLADLGAHIIAQRAKWFHDIRSELSEEYRAISGSEEDLRLLYRPSQDVLSGIAADEASISEDDVRATLKSRLDARFRDEIERREAFVGPHRDDFAAELSGRDVGSYGSQGENRSAVIALKLAQLKLFSREFGKTPLFLLDDVASELDATRCRYLFRYLRDEQAQVFLTTTENDLIGDEFSGRSTVFRMEQGLVTPS